MIIEKETEIEKFYNLILKIQSEPNLGLQDFYAEYGKFILGTARIFRNSPLTEIEILQDVLIKIWRTAQRPKVIKNPKGWIYTIAVNSAKSALRKRRDLSLNENIVSVKDGIEDFIERDSFEYLIRDLSLTEKEIILQRILLKSTFEEIAMAMKKSVNTISTTYYRSIKKIGVDLEKFLKN